MLIEDGALETCMKNSDSQKMKNTEINYFYIRQYERESRMKYQKHKLVAMGADPNKTEHEIMQSLKSYRIYNCGNIKFEYKRLT